MGLLSCAVAKGFATLLLLRYFPFHCSITDGLKDTEMLQEAWISGWGPKGDTNSITENVKNLCMNASQLLLLIIPILELQHIYFELNQVGDVLQVILEKECMLQWSSLTCLCVFCTVSSKNTWYVKELVFNRKRKENIPSWVCLGSGALQRSGLWD